MVLTYDKTKLTRLLGIDDFVSERLCAMSYIINSRNICRTRLDYFSYVSASCLRCLDDSVHILATSDRLLVTGDIHESRKFQLRSLQEPKFDIEPSIITNFVNISGILFSIPEDIDIEALQMHCLFDESSHFVSLLILRNLLTSLLLSKILN